MLWNINDKLSLGAGIKTPFTADLKHESSTNYDTPEISDEKLDMPLSYGVGIAYRFSDAFTLSLDIHRTEWDDFIHTDANGRQTSPITGKPISESSSDPTHQVRVGSEYLFINPKYTIPLRGGVFYDPAPSEGSPDDFYGISVGSGFAKGIFVFDIAYQYRFGNDVGTAILQGLEFSQDVEEQFVYASVILYF